MSIATLRHIAIAGAGALLLSVQTASAFGPTAVYRATEAIDYVLGSTRAIGYFQTVAGQCQLTLMIAEVVDQDRAAPESAARLRFAMQPGQVAVVGTNKVRRYCSPAAPKLLPYKSRAPKRTHDCVSQTNDGCSRPAEADIDQVAVTDRGFAGTFPGPGCLRATQSRACAFDRDQGAHTAVRQRAAERRNSCPG